MPLSFLDLELARFVYLPTTNLGRIGYSTRASHPNGELTLCVPHEIDPLVHAAGFQGLNELADECHSLCDVVATHSRQERHRSCFLGLNILVE